MKKRWLWGVAVVLVAALGVLFGAAIATRAVAGIGGEKEISLNSPGGPDQASVTLSKSHLDRVRWYNRDDRGHVIMFTDWPFLEPPEAIAVKAGEKSRWYTVYPDQKNGSYPYTFDPPVKSNAPGQGPPGEPDVTVGD